MTPTKTFLLGSIIMGLAAGQAAAATFSVNSTLDAPDLLPGDGICGAASGLCTLRAAIEEANATPGADTIAFAIGAGVQQITVGSPLPAISESVTLDGTTQPGYVNTPLIVVYGAGLKASGLVVAGDGTTIRRLAVNGFAGHGITVSGGSGNVIERNYIGTDQTGTMAVPNKGSGVLVDHAPGTLVQYNLISGNDGKGNSAGIEIELSSGTLVRGNLIGTDISGFARLGNTGRGIAIHNSPNNEVRGNVIDANRGSGVRIYGGTSTGNLIEGNYIGVALDATCCGLGNFAGVQIRSDDNIVRNNLIAGNEDSGVLIWDGTANGNIVERNTIAYNHQYGVAVFSGTGNRIAGNSVYHNRLLGIELSAVVGTDPTGLNPGANLLGDGVDVNDANDLDAGPNDQQNYPVIAAATYAGGQTVINVSLNTLWNEDVRIELYASPACSTSGHGEGQYPLGSVAGTTDGQGDLAVSAVVAADLRGYALTATATNSGGSTSEFSSCFVVP